MAGETFKVTIDELRSTSQTFKTNMSQMQSAYSQMSNAVRKVANAWKGDASNEFQMKFDALYKNIETTEQLITEAAKDMTEAADLFYETETALAGMFEGLDVGTSPFDM